MFISVSGRFGQILYLFFMARIQFSRKSSALTASFCVRQCTNRVSSLNALNDSSSMSDIPSTNMLLAFVQNSTLFTSLPLTIDGGCWIIFFLKLRKFYYFINQFIRSAKCFLGLSRQSLNICTDAANETNDKTYRNTDPGNV